MSITPDDVYSVAEKLNEFPDEKYKRSAISRAYYAAFLCAREMISNSGIKLPDKRNKNLVCQLLQGTRIHPFAQKGSDLADLATIRNKADYDIDKEIKYADTKIKSGKNIIDELTKGHREKAEEFKEALAQFCRNNNLSALIK